MNDRMVPLASPGQVGCVKKGPGRWLVRGAAIAAFGAVTAAGTREAHAQYYGGGAELVPLFVAGVVVEGGTVIGGVVSAIGSSSAVAKGEVRRGWFISSYVFGGLNLVAAALFGAAAAGNRDMVAPWAAFSAAHGAIGAINVAIPSIGFARGREPALALRPIVVGGTDAGGKRWNGAGVQLVGF